MSAIGPQARTARDDSRRWFLKVASLGGLGFVIGGIAAPVGATSTAAVAVHPHAPLAFNPFVLIGRDNSVVVFSKHLDKGQGVLTGLATLVAEELDADWSQVRAEFAPADASRYRNFAFGPVQGTGGSSSIANSWLQYRQAGAAARAMLVAAAAERWQVPAAEVRVSAGRLDHSSGKTASFGELAQAASTQTPPEDSRLKTPDQFRLIGTRVPRLDSAAKTDGSAAFTIDLVRPDMHVAMLARPPRFGGRVQAVDDTAARGVPGVRAVLTVERGVAVVADSYFSASRGRDALRIEWDDSQAETRGSPELFETFKRSAQASGEPVESRGEPQAALDGAARTVTAEYEFPFLAHATMEPMDCLVQLSADGCEIWTGSQIPTLDQGAVAALTGMAPADIQIHTQFAGGSFGRRAVPDSDYIVEAVSIAKALGDGRPVKLQWSREDDMRGGRYRPMSFHRMSGGVDADGQIVAWRHRAVVPSFMKGTMFDRGGLDGSAVEGARNLPYAIANMEVDLHQPAIGVPTLWWRSVGHTQNGYVTEVFLDELAHLGGQDPYQARRRLLAEHPRHLAVLDAVAHAAGWEQPLADRRGRGIAIHRSFGTIVAEVVEVTVADSGEFSVDRVVCAVDCGIAVNPDVIEAQMEGGIGYALSAALREEITLEGGRVVQGNFDRYRPLRNSEMPAVEVHIVASDQPPSGVGEPGVPPLAPALSNALFAASGKRIRKLPIGDQLKAQG